MIYFYRFLWFILAPIVDIWFFTRLLKNKEDKNRIMERLGFSKVSRPNGCLIWFHCASVGESLSILPLIHTLLEEDKDLNILVTTGTVTSAQLMKQRLPKGAIHQYVPIDFYFSVKSFMEHWQPNLSIFVESELWPELCTQAPNPIIINGRISENSARRYKKLGFLSRFLFKNFHIAFMQTEEDKNRLQSIANIPVEISGNLKFDSPPPTADEKELSILKEKLKGKKVFVASSTHAGEELTLAALSTKIQAEIPNLVTIIVPRHPNRGNDIKKELTAHRLNCSQRSKGEDISPLYIADTLGEMGLWYNLADVVFVGKSLVEGGGQNPYEPLQCGKVTLCGPHMFNFKKMMHIFKEREIILQSNNLKELEKDLVYFLKHDKQRHLAEKRIKENVQGLGGATAFTANKIMNIIKGYS